jgi:hypothetical protein
MDQRIYGDSRRILNTSDALIADFNFAMQCE